MRRLDLTFSALLIPLDLCAILGAALTAYALRFSKYFTDLKPVLQDIPLPTYLSTTIIFAFAWLILFAIGGLYVIKQRRAWGELGRIILSVTAGIMLVIAVVFFRREYTTSRFIVLAVWPLSIVYVWFGRLLIRTLRHALLRRGIGHQRLAIIGNQTNIDQLRHLYKQNGIYGCTVTLGIRGWHATAHKQLLQYIKQNKIDAILLADPNLPKQQALEIIHVAEDHHLRIRYLADLFAARFSNVEMITDGGIPILEVKRTPLDGWGRIAKRIFDLIGSTILIVLLAPVMLFAAFAILLDSRGGVLFSRLPDRSRLMRVGEGGRPFPYFKFRTMFKDVHWQRYKELASLNTRNGPVLKLRDDPRITHVGRFLRIWSIDELPELFLVWSGHMSLVGPRPHHPEEVEHYTSVHRRVLMIKPGMTGMAQISGRSSLSFDEEVRLDTWYIENWSLWRDLYILLKTPFVVLSHRGVEEVA